MMKTLFISYDGMLDFVAQSQAIPYLKGLAKSGVGITVMSFEKPDKIREKEALKRCRDMFGADNIEWLPGVYHKSPAIPATVFDVLSGVITGFRLVKAKKIGIVHARGYIPMMMAVAIKYLCGVRVLFDMRGFWPDEKVDAGAWRADSALYKIMKGAERFLISKADEIVVLTASARESILEPGIWRADITVLPCCVDLELFTPKNADPPVDDKTLQGRTVILYAGNLGSFYDLAGMLDFFRRYKKRREDAFMWFLTNYPEEAILKTAAESSIGRRDLRVSSLGHDEMPGAFSRADFSLMFYNRKRSGKGCSPIKMGESLACGVPVIVNAGIGDCDGIIAANDVGVVMNGITDEEFDKAFVKMERLSSDRTAARRCAETAARLFSLESGIARYEAVYRRMRN